MALKPNVCLDLIAPSKELALKPNICLDLIAPSKEFGPLAMAISLVEKRK